MATIGTETFVTMQGQVQLAAAVVSALESQSGEDYNRWRSEGIRAPDSQLETVAFADDAAAVTALVTAYAALQGTSVTVVDAFGVSTDNVKIISVRPTSKVVIKDGEHVARVSASWTVRVGPPPVPEP